MTKPKGKKKTDLLTVIINVLIILFTLLVVFFAWKLVQETIPYIESRKEYNDLEQFTVLEEDVPAKEVVESTPALEDKSEAGAEG